MNSTVTATRSLLRSLSICSRNAETSKSRVLTSTPMASPPRHVAGGQQAVEERQRQVVDRLEPEVLEILQGRAFAGTRDAGDQDDV